MTQGEGCPVAAPLASQKLRLHLAPDSKGTHLLQQLLARLNLLLARQEDQHIARRLADVDLKGGHHRCVQVISLRSRSGDLSSTSRLRSLGAHRSEGWSPPRRAGSQPAQQRWSNARLARHRALQTTMRPAICWHRDARNWLAGAARLLPTESAMGALHELGSWHVHCLTNHAPLVPWCTGCPRGSGGRGSCG